MDTIYVATLTTPNFEFTAAGRTREQAHIAIHDAWDVHCRQYPRADHALIHEYGIVVQPMQLGAAYRDREMLVASQPAF